MGIDIRAGTGAGSLGQIIGWTPAQRTSVFPVYPAPTRLITPGTSTTGTSNASHYEVITDSVVATDCAVIAIQSAQWERAAPTYSLTYSGPGEFHPTADQNGYVTGNFPSAPNSQSFQIFISCCDGLYVLDGLCNQYGGQTFQQLINWIIGWAEYDIASMISNAVNGLSAQNPNSVATDAGPIYSSTGSQSLFASSVLGETAVYNPSNFLISAGVDCTCLCIDALWEYGSGGGTLVSSDVMLCAEHYPPAHLWFLGSDGIAYPAEPNPDIARIAIIDPESGLATDLLVTPVTWGFRGNPVTGGVVKPAKVLPANYAEYLAPSDIANGLLSIRVNQAMCALITSCSYLAIRTGTQVVYFAGAAQPPYQSLATGWAGIEALHDSGGFLGFALGTELVYCASVLGANSGPSAAYYHDLINTAIASFGGAPLADVDLSSYMSV